MILQKQEQGMGVLTPPMRDFLRTRIGDDYTYATVTGGLVHAVFRITTPREEYYLKVLGDVWAGVPSRASNPRDIRHEINALQAFYTAAPDSFPRVVASDPSHGMVLLTPIMTPKINLERLLNAQTVDALDAARIGQAVADTHRKLAPGRPLLRGAADAEYYSYNLDHRLNCLGYEPLSKVTERLKAQTKQPIFGDLSPKNMGLDRQGVYFCDLENSHYGNVTFDTGFMAAHLLLHTLGRPDIDLVTPFLAEYKAHNEFAVRSVDEDLLLRVVLGICLYRFDSVVPYRLPLLSGRQRIAGRQTVLALLHYKRLTLEMISGLKV